MGFYLNPGNKGFWESIRSKIYVDKTGLIACTNDLVNTQEKYICVSRPRRFGKSMALKMLAAYYSRGCDSADLFKEFEIKKNETFREHLNQYDVIFLNMQQFLIEADSEKVTEYLEQEVLDELNEEYEEILKEKKMGLAAALRRIYTKTDRQFIFLIDEWDCVMRERQESEALQKQYLDFLRNLLKDQPYVALAYMTGILPVKKYGLKQKAEGDHFALFVIHPFTRVIIAKTVGSQPCMDMPDFCRTRLPEIAHAFAKNVNLGLCAALTPVFHCGRALRRKRQFYAMFFQHFIGDN